MKRIVLHVRADVEVKGAAAHYDRERPGLGRRFRLEFEAAAGQVARRPETYPIEIGSVHRCPLNGFPYDVYYVIEPESIWILAVAHRHRRPRYWSKRRPG